MGAHIEFMDVSFCYAAGRENSLQSVSFTVPRGQCVLLCGKSGCGKTTLTKLVNGIIPHLEAGAMAGQAHIAGTPVEAVPMHELAKTVASVFQNPKSQFFNVESESEITFALENQGLPLDVVEARLHETVQALGIGHLMGKTMFGMSGGEKQIIAFACAYAARPAVLVLDEPSANLDGPATEAIAGIMAKMKAAGTTILIAEHRVAWLQQLADRVLLLEDGHVTADKSAAAFFTMGDEARKLYGLRSLCSVVSTAGQASGVRNMVSKHAPGKHTLEIQDLRLAHGKATIAKSLSFTLRSGDIVALTGHNGAGKTTLSRCLCGLHREAGGTVLWDGKPLPYRKRRRRAAFVMQDVNHQLFADSVENECLLGDRTRRREDVMATLTEFGLAEYTDTHPQALSGGQKQRLAVAVALLEDKDIFIFDEPTSGLDYENMLVVCRMLRRLANQDKLVLVVTHDVELIEQVCTGCVQMGE